MSLLKEVPTDPILPTYDADATHFIFRDPEMIEDWQNMIKTMQKYRNPKQFLQDTLYARLDDFVLKNPETALLDTSLSDTQTSACSSMPADQGGGGFDDVIMKQENVEVSSQRGHG